MESGLYLPEGAKEEASEALLGEVLEVARTMPQPARFFEEKDEDGPDITGGDFGTNVSGIPMGSMVLFAKNRGVTIPWGRDPPAPLRASHPGSRPRDLGERAPMSARWFSLVLSGAILIAPLAHAPTVKAEDPRRPKAWTLGRRGPPDPRPLE